MYQFVEQLSLNLLFALKNRIEQQTFLLFVFVLGNCFGTIVLDELFRETVSGKHVLETMFQHTQQCMNTFV